MRKFLLLLVIVVTLNTAYSQQEVTLNNIVPPSPEATAFIKYGNYEVGPYTGKPDISIPIYEIKTNKLSVPITLSYDATGIRVNDRAGWVGLNWSLNAGGQVSQMVVGKQDVMTTGTIPRAADVVNNSTYFTYLESLAEGVGLSVDGEPDKFFYNLPNGAGGSFVLNNNRDIIQIPRTSRKISYDGSVVKIIDESGTTYIFNTYETTEVYTYSAQGPSPVLSTSGSSYSIQKTGYYLSEIISSDRIEHIYFTYENETTSTKDDSYSEYFGDTWTTLKVSNYHSYMWTGVKRVISIPRLKTITFLTEKLNSQELLADRMTK